MGGPGLHTRFLVTSRLWPMLTKLVVRDFKGLVDAEIELDNPVVFVGPNDSGKTSALQALALWDLGLRRWTEKRGDSAPPQRPGVAASRRDLLPVPVPSARLLWRELRVRQTYRDADRRGTQNIRIEVIVEGVSGRERWSSGMEFDYTNEESFYCRPLRINPDGTERMPVLPRDRWPNLAFLNPMSGLASNETRLDPGAIDVRIGEGRTAEVLRNLCLQVTELPDGKERWDALAGRIGALFGVRINRPLLIPHRGEVEVTYLNRFGTQLDLSSAGRGMLQTLLLLAFIDLNQHSVLLLDEPDAHLEILRQREIYKVLRQTAASNGVQVICASHSEVILNEAAQHDAVVAFVGSPHRVEKKAQVLKALSQIKFEDYYNAEITGFVLYVEGLTHIDILLAFASVLQHEARHFLERPFVHYVGNNPGKARSHFYGLREAKDDLVGYALFDRLHQGNLGTRGDLAEHMWPRREIENYLLPTVTLLRYAEQTGRASVRASSTERPGTTLFEEPEGRLWRDVMQSAVENLTPPVALHNLDHQFWSDTKISDSFLKPLFDRFYSEMGLPILLRKKNYYRLVSYLSPSEVHRHVVEVLDGIAKGAARAADAMRSPVI